MSHIRLINRQIACPVCGQAMMIAKGNRGLFWGCTQYPGCEGRRDFATKEPLLIGKAKLAAESLQLLRAKAHDLLEAKFPDKKIRYPWLVRHAPSIHMSELNRKQLIEIITALEPVEVQTA